MKRYKYVDIDNKTVYIIDEDGLSRSSGLASVVPNGIEIEPADVPDPKIETIANIDKLEAEAGLGRAARELVLQVIEAVTAPIELSNNLSYQKIKAKDNEIKALRDLL